MEMLWYVDEEDRVIGSVSRDEAHRNMLLHRTGIVFLFDSEDRVFLQHRANKPTFPNRYDASSSFHVTYGEDYETAAKRELQEETGVRVALRYVGKFVHHDSPEHQIVAVFVGSYDGKIRLDPTEAVNGIWYEQEAADKIIKGGNVTPWLRDGWKLWQKTLA